MIWSNNSLNLSIFETGAYLVIGAVSLYLGEVWYSPAKRLFVAVVGFLFVAVAILGFAFSTVGKS